MFCGKCGVKNDDDAVFCRECGAKLTEEPEYTDPTPDSSFADHTDPAPDSSFADHTDPALDSSFANHTDPTPNSSFADYINPTPENSFANKITSVPKKFMAIAGGIIAAVIILIVVLVNTGSAINLNKYVTVTYSGYEGYGNATAEIDWNAIEKKYGSKVKFTKKATARINSLFGGDEFAEDNSPIMALEDYIANPVLDKTSGLSNGDKITYKWDIDEKELYSIFKCKIKYSDKTVTVSDLQKIKEFDPFEDLSVEFTGVNSEGKVKLTYKGDTDDAVDASSFYCDKEDGLSNGDEIVISIGDDVEYYAEAYGKIPSETEKKYKVEGLGKYAAKLSEISDATLKEAKKQAEIIIKDDTSDFDETEKLSAITYVGDYLEVAKDTSSYINNDLGLVYKIDVNVQPEGGKSTPVTFYYDVRYRDVVVKEDKSCEIDYENYSTPGETISVEVEDSSSFWGSAYYSYCGFESLEELIKDRNDSYDTTTIEWNVEGASTTVAATNNEDYICEYSSEREITKDEINSYMKKDYSSYGFPGNRTIIQMIINEMYARHGYSFADKELTDYFNQKEWYSSITNKTNDMDSIYKNMSSVEQANVTLLQEYK